MPNQLSFMRGVIYSLKRQFGVRLDLYALVKSEVDYETGRKNVEKKCYTILRGILLPRDISRKFNYDLSYIAANKNFTYGGVIDYSRRTIIIDMRDYPAGYKASPGDYAVISHTRYNIEKVEQFDDRQIIVMDVVETKDEPPNTITILTVFDTLELGNSVRGEV